MMLLIKKRLLLSLLMCGLLFSCNGVNKQDNENHDSEPSQSIEYEENEQGLAFYPQDDGTYAVGAGNAFCLETINIPSTYRGKAVTRIMEFGFGQFNNDGQMYSKFKKVVVPESIKNIGNYAFSDSTLETISLPRSLVEIGELVFMDCPLKTIEYNGTFTEFENISFASRWIEVKNEDQISLKFSDKSVLFIDLFDSLKLRAALEQEFTLSDYKFTPFIEGEITITKRDSDYYAFKVMCYKGTNGLGNLKRNFSEYDVEIEDETIVSLFAKSVEEFRLLTINTGTTTITIRGEGLTKTFTLNIIDKYIVTVAEAYTLFDSHNANLIDKYSITGVAHKDNNGNEYIKDNLLAEQSIRLPFNSNLEEGTNITVNGYLGCYNNLVYFNRLYFNNDPEIIVL